MKFKPELKTFVFIKLLWGRGKGVELHVAVQDLGNVIVFLFGVISL